MQLFSADVMVISKKFKIIFFWPWKSEKTGLKSCSYLAQTLLCHRPAQATAQSPKSTFHIKKSRDQTSVLLSVVLMSIQNGLGYQTLEITDHFNSHHMDIREPKLSVQLFNRKK